MQVWEVALSYKDAACIIASYFWNKTIEFGNYFDLDFFDLRCFWFWDWYLNYFLIEQIKNTLDKFNWVFFYLPNIVIQQEKNPLQILDLPIIYILNLLKLKVNDLSYQRACRFPEKCNISFDILRYLFLKSKYWLKTLHFKNISNLN